MAFNPSGAVDCDISVFGSWVTETDPVNLPPGVSPDCPGCAFVPGNVFTRPALQKVFNPPLAANVTVTYGKSYVAPNGTIYNLYLASNGILYSENVTTSPGTATALFTSFPNLYARSVTAFGREYLAISDGLHGQDVPLQFDGTNLDRVTQDGPGTPPTVSSVQLPATTMTSSGNTLTRQNNTVTGVTATPNGLQVGYQVQISNVPDSNSTSVVQTNTSGSQAVNGSVWQLASGQYRSLFNPGTSALGDFIAQGFGFTIPSSATILGVVATLSVVAQATTAGTVAQVALWNSSGMQGTAKSPATPITTTSTATAYGSPADLWGATLTPAVVNDPSFGFAASVAADSIRDFLNFPFTVQVYYTLSGSGTIADIDTIVINNEVTPGLALVTTNTPHGLVPNIFVSIVGVEPGTVANVAAAQWVAGTTTLTTTQDHNLTPGAIIQVASVTTSTGSTTFSFNGTFQILQVPAPNQMIYAQVPITALDPDVIDATASTGALTVAWPIPSNTPTPTYFQVESTPSPTTFYIQVTYSDATWTTGTVGFAWEGTFYVTAILSSTIFQYQQYGPNGATTAVGTVTPFGQAAPGIHQCRISFQTRQGSITKPSPWVQFIANGGQYIQVSDMATGPPNIQARILEFTGALGSQFYYLAVPAQVNGQIVSTATQVNDNTTTSILLDFSDNSLFAGTSTSIPGNNTPAQITMDGALGFASFESYLIMWGQRNRVTSLLNMGFDGGVTPNLPNTPTGWTQQPGGGFFSVVTSPRGNGLGGAWSVSNTGTISQSGYQDQTGDPILTPNTQYSYRVWLRGAGTLVATISSTSTGFTSSTTFTFTDFVGHFFQQDFSLETPLPIPSDMILSLTATAAGATVIVDEGSLIFTANPFTNSILNVSYANNPEAFDGVTGETGPGDDPHQVMDFATIADIPYILTRDPGGRLHEISATGTTLPSGWQVNERASNCGVLSAFCLTKSQADDNSSSGGEEWFAWASETGARIFGGNQPWKISQEIQPNWNSGSDFPTANEINLAAATTCYSMNDPVGRVVYFFLPLGTAASPSAIYTVNYRELDSAEAIAQSAPYRTGMSGKLIATDNTRKWSPWYLGINGGARMYRSASELVPTFFAGARTGGAFGNVYILNPNKFTDDDYGAIQSWYTTAALPSRDQEEALQLGSWRKIITYMGGFFSGVGNIVITLFPESLTNEWPLNCLRPLSAAPIINLEYGGGNCEAYRTFFRITPQASSGTDQAFRMSRFVVSFRKSKIGVRGTAT
jgi:hypothetical protein